MAKVLRGSFARIYRIVEPSLLNNALEHNLHMVQRLSVPVQQPDAVA